MQKLWGVNIQYGWQIVENEYPYIHDGPLLDDKLWRMNTRIHGGALLDDKLCIHDGPLLDDKLWTMNTRIHGGWGFVGWQIVYTWWANVGQQIVDNDYHPYTWWVGALLDDKLCGTKILLWMTNLWRMNIQICGGALLDDKWQSTLITNAPLYYKEKNRVWKRGGVWGGVVG
jgi:hypothetical protein